MSTAPVVSITDELLAEIEQEACMATPGQWQALDSPVGEIYVSGPCDEFICGAIDHVHDANLIALANPKNMLALIVRLRADEQDAARWRFFRIQDGDSKAAMVDAAIDAAMQQESTP